MFFNFVDELREAGIKASFKEHLVLLEALDKEVIERTPEEFYYLSRAIFVKDEGCSTGSIRCSTKSSRAC